MGWRYRGGNDPCAGSETIRLHSLCIPQGGEGRRGGVSGGLKNFCREKGGGTEKCLKTGRGIANFFRCHWKITYLQESSWYL